MLHGTTRSSVRQMPIIPFIVEGFITAGVRSAHQHPKSRAGKGFAKGLKRLAVH